jgi:hypothetical protein
MVFLVIDCAPVGVARDLLALQGVGAVLRWPDRPGPATDADGPVDRPPRYLRIDGAGRALTIGVDCSAPTPPR